jgi:hypothetical protein
MGAAMDAEAKKPTDERRFPDDAFLRRFGWRIVSRPDRGPAIWINPGGMVMTASAAVAHVQTFLRETLGKQD